VRELEESGWLDAFHKGVCLARLATIARKQGDPELARKHIDEAMVNLDPFGEDGMTARWPVVAEYGLVYGELGEFEMAEKIIGAQLDDMVEEHAGGPDLPYVMERLAAVYIMQEKYELAEPLLTRALTLWNEKLGAGHRTVASAHGRMARLHIKQEKFEHALPELDHALAILEKVFRNDHRELADVLSDLGQLKHKLGKLEKAETLLRRSIAMRERLPEPLSPVLPSDLEVLAEICRQTGRAEEAETLRKKAATIRKTRD